MAKILLARFSVTGRKHSEDGILWKVKRAKPLPIPKHSGVHCGHSSSASVVGNANVHTYTSMVY